MRILQAVPGSVLWLLKESGQAVPNLRKAAESLGVAGDRIIFADRMALDRHLARHALADLFLDTLPYNAHTTASDALWAGLPVLTCIGSLFPGRVAASLLKAMSLDILITTNSTEYETAAIHWARNPQLLESLRQSLGTRRRSSALFDARRFTHHLEVAYACMQDRVKSGLPPAGFAVLSEGGVNVLPSDG
jgi:predicted O-linked N-acetylglucosamine transferase (SPINDLY family)